MKNYVRPVGVFIAFFWALVCLFHFPCFILFPESFAAQAAPKSRVAYTVIAGILTPIWIAAEERLFQKYSLDAELVFISGSPVTISSLVSGEIDFAAPGAEPTVSAILGGADVSIVAFVANRTPVSLYVEPNITKAEDLKGKTVALTSFTSSTAYLLKVFLGEVRLEQQKDVQVTQSGGYVQSLAALSVGRVQGAMLSPPISHRAEAMGFKKIWSGLGVEYPATTIAVRKSYLKISEETVGQFLQAVADGVHIFKTDRERAIKVMAQYTNLKDRTILEKTYADNKDVHNQMLLPTVSGVKTILEVLAPVNPKAANARPENFIDVGPLKKLEERGFFKKFPR
jgi:NitT/TauT family transport system substrate-binding protein